MHHMVVELLHDRERIVGMDARMLRAPWSTCPGAEARLAATFVGSRLGEAARVGSKKHNCTHLFDLAVLGAAHACDTATTRYDISVTDPVDGMRELALLRNDRPEMRWFERRGKFSEPVAIAGLDFLRMGDWIASLDAQGSEMARLLRGAAIISHGRTIPMDQQSDASRVPANCYTFQPGQRENAVRTGKLRDFTAAMHRPLDGLR